MKKLFLLLLFYSCNNLENKIAENRKEYLTLLKELHSIECEHLHRYGIENADSGFYQFRSVAFQQVLKNPDRAALAQYELLYQQLAYIEHRLTEEETKVYLEDINSEYKTRCR